ncbi:MAG: hypothetical protein ABIF22_03195 [bacterium]
MIEIKIESGLFSLNKRAKVSIFENGELIAFITTKTELEVGEKGEPCHSIKITKDVFEIKIKNRSS